MLKIPFKKIVFINGLLWTGWMFFYALIVFYQIPTMEKFIYALNSSFIITCPLFILSLLLWPLCRAMDWQKMPGWLFWMTHTALANIFAVLWLSIIYGAAYLMPANPMYVVLDLRQTVGWQYPQGILKYMVVCGFYYAFIYYRASKESELREAQLRLSLREAEWKSLKAHINPHFLFNSLNSINALITSKPGSARRMLVQLAEILRRSLTENPTLTTTLEEELAFAHQYLELEKIRLSDRLHYEETIDEQLLNYPIPTMLLQPLIENAIKHGISQARQGGWIRVNIHKQNGHMVGSVENSMDKEYSDKAGDFNESTGLKNLQQRLALIYGKDLQFSAQRTDGNDIFRVSFHFPMRNKDKTGS